MDHENGSASHPSRRGRPPKYGRPAKVVAITLPAEIVDTLQRINADLGWAVVSLVEKSARSPRARPAPREDARLAEIGERQSLIVVDTARFPTLPGARMIPLTDTHAFLALEPGRGLADLELALIDRIERLGPGDERRSLERLRDRLRRWRRNRRLRFESRSIVIVSRASDGDA